MPTLALQPGETVFVTGVNGHVGSHVANQLLAHGYNVRGAVRDVEKSKWMTEYFDAKYQNAKLELVSVPDMTVDGCYDEGVKGVSGVIHIALPLGGSKDDSYVPQAVQGVISILKSAAKSPSVKRVVYTSSTIAASSPKPGVEFTVDEKSYNHESLDKIKEEYPPHLVGQKMTWLYAAAKTVAEEEMWKWMEENKPQFVLNSILPNVLWGKVLVPEKQGYPSTIAWMRAAFTGENFGMYSAMIEPQSFISNRDTAILHVSALIHSDVSSERLFGISESWTWNKVLAILRKLYPDRKFPEDVPDEKEDKTKSPTERALEVLRWLKGSGSTWDSLEEAIKATTEDWARE